MLGITSSKMTGLILQDSKNIPVTYNTKNHYKTTQDLGLQSNATVQKTTIFFCHCWKKRFLPGCYHRKSAHFQEFYYHISRYKGREKNPLTSLILRKIMVHFTKPWKAGISKGSIAQHSKMALPPHVMIGMVLYQVSLKHKIGMTQTEYLPQPSSLPLALCRLSLL